MLGLTHGEITMAVLTAIYVCLTGTYVLISYRTLKAIKRQAELTAKSADVAKKSVDALANIERPWIVVTIRDGVTEQYLHDPKTKEIKNRLFFNWFLTNHGKTTALVYEIIALLEIKTHDEVDELRRTGAENQPKLRPDAFIIGPGQAHEFSGINMVPFWTPEQRKSVFDREAYLVAHGIVKYRDMIDSSVIHQTPFIGLYVYAEDFKEGTFRRFYDAPGYNKYT
jgi:hypothetical protein